MHLLTIFFILFALIGCGKTPDEERSDAIDVAQTYLSDGDCDQAIEVLEDVGRDLTDPIYVQVLASAYACKANFNTIKFISDDLEDINTTAAGLMRSLSIMSLSDETTADSEEYEALREALDILYASGGGTQPSQARRTATFGARKAGDIGLQIVILSAVQFGKFLNLYGNVSGTGVKGGGTNTNSCFIDYSYANAQAAVSAVATDACSSFNDGHPSLSFSAPNLETTKRRLCEGLTLLTNQIDVLDNIDVTGSDTFDDLEDVATVARASKTAAIAADASLSTLLNMTSRSLCETTLDTASQLNNMELIYALIFEAGLP